MATEPITVGYWSIRGLAAPLRMMVMYANVPLNAVIYDLAPKSDGTGFDGSCWLTEKPVLKAQNPLINLPYVKVGDVIISQTNACFMFLGRKLNMLGHNEKETSECEQLLCEIFDIRNVMVGLVYNGASCNKEGAIAAIEKVAGKNGSFSKLELWLSTKIAAGSSTGAFLVGNSATAPDFHLFEMLDQFTKLADYYEQSPFMAPFPLLTKFKQFFEVLPQNQKYLSSQLATLPFNNKMAAFGATVTGDPWKTGMTYDFAKTGLY